MKKEEEMGKPEHQKKRKKSKEKKKLNMAKPTLSKYIAYLVFPLINVTFCVHGWPCSQLMFFWAPPRLVRA